MAKEKLAEILAAALMGVMLLRAVCDNALFLGTLAVIAAMGAALKSAARGDDWKRGVGIPHAATWLNQRRWESAPEVGTMGAEDAVQQQEVARW